MNEFYKLPTKFEDTNPLYYINLTNIQSISMTTEVLPSANGGLLKRACLIVNGIKYVYDSVNLTGMYLSAPNDKKKAKEIEETNAEKELEFKRIQTRLEMIIQDIMEKAQLCRQKSNEIEIERLKSAFALDTEMLEKAEKRENNAKEVIEKIKAYCEDKYTQNKDENNALAGIQRDFAAHVLNIINDFN